MKATIVWFDIPVTNMSRAVTFYEALLGVTLQRVSCGSGTEMAMFPGGIGCLAQEDGLLPSEQGTSITFGTDGAVSEVLSRAVKAGATIVRDVTAIDCEDRGVFAIIRDTEGNRIGIHGMK